MCLPFAQVYIMEWWRMREMSLKLLHFHTECECKYICMYMCTSYYYMQVFLPTFVHFEVLAGSSQWPLTPERIFFYASLFSISFPGNLLPGFLGSLLFSLDMIVKLGTINFSYFLDWQLLFILYSRSKNFLRSGRVVLCMLSLMDFSVFLQ